VVNPVTVTGEVVFEPEYAPQLVNAVKDEIAPPPTSEGAVTVTDTDVPLADVAVPIVGALGTFKAL